MTSFVPKYEWQQYTADAFVSIPTDLAAGFLAEASAMFPDAIIQKQKRVAYALYMRELLAAKWDYKRVPKNISGNFRLLIPEEVLRKDYPETELEPIQARERQRLTRKLSVEFTSVHTEGAVVPTYKALLWARRVDLDYRLAHMHSEGVEFLECSGVYKLPVECLREFDDSEADSERRIYRRPWWSDHTYQTCEHGSLKRIKDVGIPLCTKLEGVEALAYDDKCLECNDFVYHAGMSPYQLRRYEEFPPPKICTHDEIMRLLIRENFNC